MTASCVHWLSRGARLVPASPMVVAGAARWLARAQSPDGTWPPPRTPLNPPAQADLPLTAHALLALLQVKGSEVLYKNNINKAVDHVARAVTSPDNLDAYSLAIAARALAAAKHPQATLALQALDKHANTTEDSLFWSRKLYGLEWRNPWLRENSLAAATAAAAAQAMLAAGRAEDVVPVVRFLMRASHPSNPDPDVLDAIAEFGKIVRVPTKLRVSLNMTGSEDTRQFNIDDDNALSVQTQLLRAPRAMWARTAGRGVGAAGAAGRARTNVTAPWPRYTLDPRVDAVSTTHRLQLSVCIGFVAQGNETQSGLALLVVQLPTGFVADIHTLTELTSARHVLGGRVVGSGSRVEAWVAVARAERCATLAAPRALPSARQRPGIATLQDLYDSSHRARVFFRAPAGSACDACRAWASCARVCGAAAEQRAPDAPAAPGHATRARLHTVTVLLVFIFIYV